MFYQVIAHRVTCREFWWESKYLLWVAALIKLFRLTPRASTDDLAVESLHPFEVDGSTIAPDVMARFAPALAELQQLGFGQALWHDQTDVYQATRNILATLVHSSGQAFVRVQCRMNMGGTPPKVKFFSSFISRCRDGSWVVSSNGKADMAWPEEHRVTREVDLPLAQLWDRHRMKQSRQTPVSISGAAGLRDAAEAYHVSLRDFHVRRGVFVPLPEAEQALYRVGTGADTVSGAPVAGAPAAGMDLMEVATFAELERIQGKSRGWRSFMALLVISLVLFVGSSTSQSGSGRWDWQYVLIIVPVLLVHEMGHYVAMRVFGYRNLRMFFIPFLGAAVSGRHYNVPGWKKVIVSLMGPLPGIFLGAILGVVGVVLQQDKLVMAGMLALILNAFNLLPILPFDGGWIAHAILFCRHYMLDVAFRVIAAAALIAMGLFIPGGKVLLCVGIFMLVALPTSLKLARLVSQLRRQGFVPASTDGRTIPPEVARPILAHLRVLFPRRLGPKVAAQHTLHVFETLNARPPGVLASLGFLAVHGISFLFAVVFALGLVGSRQPYYGRGYPTMAAPRYPLDSASPVRGGGATLGDDYESLVIRFASDQAASSAMAETFLRGPSQVAVTRLGRTLIISLPGKQPALRQQLFSQWEKQAEDVFVEHAGYRAELDLRCVAPSEAVAMEIEAQSLQYFSPLPWARLTPPWATQAEWPAAQRAADCRARQIVWQIQDSGPEANVAAQNELVEQVLAAQKRGDTEEVARLRQRHEALREEGRRRYFEHLRAQYPQSPIIDLWERGEQEKDYRKRKAWQTKEIAPLLGLWPTGAPSGALAMGGWVRREGVVLSFQSVRFGHLDAGAALLGWLREQQCTDFLYDIQGMPDSEGDEQAADEDL